jgi:hypothetical protein
MGDAESRYAVTLDDFLSQRVPLEETVESQPVKSAPGPMTPEEIDRRRLLNDPTGAGRLRP